MSPPAETPGPDGCVRLRDHLVGPGQRVYVVAEAGVNHNGDVATAKAMVEAARQAGADAVKFQAFRAERLVTRTAEAPQYQKRATGAPAGQYDLLQSLELWPDAFAEINAHCQACGIAFLATPFSAEDVAMLCPLDPVAIKIASTDLTNTPLLAAAVETHLPLIVSTGAAQPDELDAAVEWLRLREAGRRLILLHCVSSYPTQPEHANLRRMGMLVGRFGVPVGFSDHTDCLETGALAVAAGAVLIEKHFTLSRTQCGPDHFFSLEPKALADYVARLRQAEQMLGSGQIQMGVCEQEVRRLTHRSVVAAKDIAAGQGLQADMMTLKRPGGGIEASRLPDLVGRVALTDIPADTPLRWEMLSPPKTLP